MSSLYQPMDVEPEQLMEFYKRIIDVDFLTQNYLEFVQVLIIIDLGTTTNIYFVYKTSWHQ